MPQPPPHRIERLTRLAALPERRVLGLMSGTSVDGLDLALCVFSGHGEATAWRLEHFRTIAYAPEDQARLRAVVSREQVSLREVTVVHAWLAALHGRMVREALAGWGVAANEVHLLASHGQTVYHAPGGWEHDGAPAHATLQLGDGDRLAVETGLLTLSDFRQKEIAAGGQGAPLAPYAEALLLAGEAPRLLLNLGGIANFSRIPPRGAGGAVLTGDTGPANGLLDRAVARLLPGHATPYDDGGALAARGRVSEPWLQRLLAHPYYARPCPKSTGPEEFGDDYLAGALAWPQAAGLTPEDVLATLTRLTVVTVAETLGRECGALEGAELAVSGGGAFNRTLMDGLRAALPGPTWREMTDWGLPPEAKEAVLFALLAHESLCGTGFPAPGGAGGHFGMGKLSWPD